MITKKELAIVLSKLEGFKEPKVIEEQYSTDPEIAASILWNAYMKGDIEQKVSVDLGCGTGLLGIASLLLGAKRVIFMDKDLKAIKIAKNNLANVKSEGYKIGKAMFINSDIKYFNKKTDTAIQNPPFGVKVRHADLVFLEKAIKTSKVIYSIHKSETLRYILRFLERKKVKVSDVWHYKMPLKATMEFHRLKIYRIDVDCLRIVV